MEEEKRMLRLEDYVNLHRTLDLMICGPIEGIYNTVDFLKEVDLISEKKSRLSKRNRDRIQKLYDISKSNYTLDTSDPEHKDVKYTELEKVINMTKEMAAKLSTLKNRYE